MPLTPNTLFDIIAVLLGSVIIGFGSTSIIILFVYFIRLLFACTFDPYQNIFIRAVPASFLLFILLFFLDGLYYLIIQFF